MLRLQNTLNQKKEAALQLEEALAISAKKKRDRMSEQNHYDSP